MYYWIRFSQYSSCILVCQNVYTISRQLNCYVYLYRKFRKGMTFIQGNVTLSTLPGFNLLDCSYQGKLQTNYAVLTFCNFKHRVI